MRVERSCAEKLQQGMAGLSLSGNILKSKSVAPVYDARTIAKAAQAGVDTVSRVSDAADAGRGVLGLRTASCFF
ncbi:hypothetical protein EYZ11_011392 [Aspergillus tanneri]|uniref:Uncharacterized protein n=1 Tax=Aspergillus tanneri TaxID=1220188 RepID=A0A4S3J887_9EURO|nr:hypothetical protein EYZ11_011392 [Aspergillus tanneri]